MKALIFSSKTFWAALYILLAFCVLSQFILGLFGLSFTPMLGISGCFA
ncbi:hypothetical protein STRDD11_02500 [Streptococcus sp. DD11]|nr:hypothetical protein STRDD11_02500 [Streptococcus sp. DD11]